MKALVYHGPGQKAWEPCPTRSSRSRRTSASTAAPPALHLEAYDVFADAADTQALKVVLSALPVEPVQPPADAAVARASSTPQQRGPASGPLSPPLTAVQKPSPIPARRRVLPA